ncbi:MAG: NAD(P)-binding domain-containing protein, partial [Hyphomicrobiaceae bacterium]
MASLRVAIAGLGAIGLQAARAVDAGKISGITLAAVSARDAEKARRTFAAFRTLPPILPLADLADAADVVIECVPAAHFRDVAEPAVRRGRIFMPLSVGALLEHFDLVDLALQTGARILVPSGAILGLDAIRAVGEGKVHSVRLVTRKPPASLIGAPFLI